MQGVFVAAVLLALSSHSAPGDETQSLRVSVREMYSTHLFVRLDLASSGEARLETVRPSATKDLRLTRAAQQELARLVEEASFESLAEWYGVCYVHNVWRHIEVETRGRKQEVYLCSLSADDVPEAQRAGALRAWRVWNALRMLFPEEYPESARSEDKALLSGPQR